MAPRTRATTTTASAPANLAAAPRRRLRVTPLDKDDTKTAKPEETAKSSTRATRGKAITLDSHDELATTTSKAAAPKPRGRPKKQETITETETAQSVEKLADKPKRATRSTRATATTVSSEAKEKPTAKATRAAKPTTRTTRAEDPAPKSEEEQSRVESAPAVKPAPKKRVTFQEIQDDKENQPIAKAGKKTIAAKTTKASSAASGLKAKPVRKPVPATRSSKRTKEQTSDDEEEQKPKKIQRILTPKKITQVNRPLTPEEASEDELNGGKTPLRDLSLSPRRPETNSAAEAIAQTLSPAKRIDFSQSLLQQSEKKNHNAESSGALTSPARRPPTSPAKLFPQSTLASVTKVFRDESSNNLASPARRPVMSPIKEGEEQSSRHVFGNASKLLFPNAHKTSQVSLAPSSSNLLQSPKRSAAFDPARIFAHSAVKPQSTNLSKSSFFSSPAKRVGLFSPLKKTTTPDITSKSARSGAQSPDLDLNDIDVTNLMHDETIEFTATSHQRSSASPMRTYKLTEEEMRLDFDDSVLEIRSPLKVAKSPVKATVLPELKAVVLQDAQERDEDMTEVLSSAQSTPHASYPQKSFVSLQAMDAEDGSRLKDLNPDLTMTDVNDDTIDLSEIAAEGTPRALITHDRMGTLLDESAPSPQEDVVAKYLRTPGTPATVYEHELTNMISSPAEQNMSPTMTLGEDESTHVMSSPRVQEEVAVKNSPVSLHEHELTNVAFTPKSHKLVTSSSPTAFHENELTNMLPSPALIEEHELTRMVSPRKMEEPTIEQSPVSVHEHELTNMLSPPHPTEHNVAQMSPASIHEHELTDMLSSPHAEEMSNSHSPASLHEHELTNMLPSPRNAGILDSRSPASLHEHELTRMLSSPPAEKAVTPNMPIPRKFNFNTVVTKVPLKPEGQESPFKLSIKKRKRPLSLGGQPDFVDIIQKPSKSPRTSVPPEEPLVRPEPVMTPASTKSTKTPASKASTIKSDRRVTSTPMSARTPLAAVTNGVLTGAVVYVDVRTSEGADASAIYIELLSGLGAKVVSSITDASLLTHIVYKDGNPKTLDKIRRASMGDGINVKTVGVSWPLDCDAKKEWVDEEAYLLNLTPTDHVIGSISRSAKRKSMEPSMLVTDGSGSVKRSRSKGRVSMRRSSIKPFTDSKTTSTPIARSNFDSVGLGHDENLATPVVNTAKKQADLEKNSLTAAWKSINATQNLGEDTPARRTLELLQKTYELEKDDWDSTILSNATEDNEENNNEAADEEVTPHPTTTEPHNLDAKDLLETGLTPAPYKTQQAQQIGSAPAKQRGIGLMSYRERVEEMERREMRDNAIGVEGGKGRGVRGRGKRVTMFGGEIGMIR